MQSWQLAITNEMELVDIAAYRDDVLHLHRLSLLLSCDTATGARQVSDEELCRLGQEDQGLLLDETKVVVHSADLASSRDGQLH